MKMCHMVADTTEELLQMVDKIGVSRRWIQAAGTHHEHFDICLSKKALALKHGALEITLKALGVFLLTKQNKEAFQLSSEHLPPHQLSIF